MWQRLKLRVNKNNICQDPVRLVNNVSEILISGELPSICKIGLKTEIYSQILSCTNLKVLHLYHIDLRFFPTHLLNQILSQLEEVNILNCRLAQPILNVITKKIAIENLKVRYLNDIDLDIIELDIIIPNKYKEYLLFMLPALRKNGCLHIKFKKKNCSVEFKHMVKNIR